MIRTKEDTGAILLMDERFMNRDYRNLFPREWNDAYTCTLGNVEKHLQAFWDVSEENDIIGLARHKENIRYTMDNYIFKR